jgi:hypothetical protein
LTPFLLNLSRVREELGGGGVGAVVYQQTPWPLSYSIWVAWKKSWGARGGGGDQDVTYQQTRDTPSHSDFLIWVAWKKSLFWGGVWGQYNRLIKNGWGWVPVY